MDWTAIDGDIEVDSDIVELLHQGMWTDWSRNLMLKEKYWIEQQLMMMSKLMVIH